MSTSLFVLAASCVGLFSWWLALQADETLREELLGRARLAAVLVSRDHLAGLLRSADDVDPAELAHLRQHLLSLRRGLPGCRSVALLGQWGTGAPAVLAQGELEAERPGQQRLAFTEADSGALSRAISDGQAGVVGPMDDGQGPRVGVYVPLGLGGGRAMVLRLDMAAEQWRLTVAARCVLPVTTLCLALGMLFWLLAAPERRSGEARPVTRRVLPPTILLALCLLLGIGLFLRVQHEQNTREEAARRTNAALAGLQKALDMQSANLLAMTQTMLASDDGRAAELVARRDAGALLARHRGLYRSLWREHGVTHMYFLAPDGACLLRVHDPARTGGVVDRHSLRESRRTGRPAAGLEFGAQGVLTLRAVTPLKLAGRVVGFLELGREIEDALRGLSVDPQVELAVLLRKDLLRRSEWEEGMRRLGRAPDWERLARDVVSFSTLGALSPEFDDAALSDLGLGGEPREALASGRQWRISAAPLADATGRPAATLVVLEDVTAAKAAFARMELLSVLGLGALLTLLAAFFFVLLRRTDRGILEREEALRKSEDTARKLSRAVEQSPATVVITDLSGAMEYVNPKFTETTGYPPEEALGQNPRILKSGEMPEEGYRELWEAITAGREWKGEFRNRKKNGELYWEFASISPIRDAAGQITHFLAVKEDITKRKAAEQALREATARAEALAAQAEAANRAKGEFLANMSHEIRTPMNAVIGLTHLALATELSERQRDFLSKIDRAARSLLGILNDILDFSKIEAGMLAVEAVDFDPRQVLDDVAGLLAVPAGEKGLALSLDVDPAVPRRLVGDPLRLGQVLLNLAGNAVKFTEKGEVRLVVAPLDGAGPGLLRLDFRVRDTGLGMTPEQVERLFQPFTQADASTTRRFGGTGLGLSISKRLVELMGGELGVTSRPGAGSEFRFSLDLPLAAGGGDGRDHLGRGADPALEARAALSGLRVLLVEDNEINQQVALGMLERAGVRAAVAGDGRRALELLAAERFDVVLMDIQMPGMDGCETARRAREELGLAGLPIIAMTADARPSDRERSREAGMDGHVTKPIEPRELYAALARHAPSRTGDRHAPNPADAAPAGRPDGTAATESALPALDAAAGLARVGGDPALYAGLFSRMLEQFAGRPAAIAQALAAGRETEARHLAHALHGVAANLGAIRLARAAAELEQAPDLGRDPAVDAGRLAELEAALAGLSGDAALLPSGPPSAPSAPSSPEELRAGLAALASALASRRPKSCARALASLEALGWPAELAEDFAQAAALTRRFRHTEALALASALQDRLKEEPAP